MDIRLRKDNGEYKWVHLRGDAMGKEDDKIIVYCAFSDIDQLKKAQFELEHQYQNGLAVIRELLQDSIIAYRLNLTKGTVEEKQTKFPAKIERKTPFPLTDDIWNWALQFIEDKENRQRFIDKFSISAMLDAWNKGISTITLPAYRLRIREINLWVETKVIMIKNPDTGDIIAVASSRDITNSENDKHAYEQSVTEEMEFVALIDVRTEKIRTVLAKEVEKKVPPKEEIDFLTYRDTLITPDIIEEELEDFKVTYTVKEMKNQLSKRMHFIPPIVRWKMNRFEEKI